MEGPRGSDPLVDHVRIHFRRILRAVHSLDGNRAAEAGAKERAKHQIVVDLTRAGNREVGFRPAAVKVPVNWKLPKLLFETCSL